MAGRTNNTCCRGRLRGFPLHANHHAHPSAAAALERVAVPRGCARTVRCCAAHQPLEHTIRSAAPLQTAGGFARVRLNGAGSAVSDRPTGASSCSGPGGPHMFGMQEGDGGHELLVLGASVSTCAHAVNGVCRARSHEPPPYPTCPPNRKPCSQHGDGEMSPPWGRCTLSGPNGSQRLRGDAAQSAGGAV
jgi:hypothetical protein